MAEITTSDVRGFLERIQGREISLRDLRAEFNIQPGTKSFDAIRNIMYQLAKQKVVKATGKNDGTYKVVRQIQPVPIFSVKRERKPPFRLMFPKDFNTGMEFDFAEHIVIREGDLVLIGGVSNYGKTTLAMNLTGENIDQKPILMGNEYTTIDDEPTPRFLNRLDSMDWVEWTNSDGHDKFTLLPVREDYAEHIVKDRINIIDWVNLDPNNLYNISPLMSDIKKAVARGIAIIVLQKSDTSDKARGGQFTKDFADCEILIDKFGAAETMLTIGKVKEYTKSITGKTYAFGIIDGVKIINFRELKKCPTCRAKGYTAKGECEECIGRKFVNV